MSPLQTIREWCFGRPPPVSPSDAARALGEAGRRADRERIRETTARRVADVAAGRVAMLGWRA